MADSPWPCLAALLSELSLSHLVDKFDDVETRDLAARASSDRVKFLNDLKQRGLTNLPERQRLTTALRGLIKRYAVLDFAGGAAAAICADTSSPLIVRATFGMANQLRVLLSYQAYAQTLGRRLIMVWHNHAACPGSFRDLFAPMAGCVVVDSLRELAMLRPEWRWFDNVPIDAIGFTAFTHPAVESTPLEAAMWEPLEPSAHIARQVDERLTALGGGPFIACHVRRT